MNTQATDDQGNRWYVFTDKGRKVTWATNADGARAKAVRIGLTVRDVEPAPSRIEERRTRRPLGCYCPLGC